MVCDLPESVIPTHPSQSDAIAYRYKVRVLSGADTLTPLPAAPLRCRSVGGDKPLITETRKEQEPNVGGRTRVGDMEKPAEKSEDRELNGPGLGVLLTVQKTPHCKVDRVTLVPQHGLSYPPLQYQQPFSLSSSVRRCICSSSLYWPWL